MKRSFVLLLTFLLNSLLGEQTFTLEEAIERALTCNRSLIISANNIENALLGIGISETEFDYKLAPILKTGYGEGKVEGKGYKYGGGVDFSKKFFQGTSINVKPQAYSTNGQWCTDVNARLTVPVLRGFGADVNLSRFRSSEFTYRSAVRQHSLNQVRIILQTIQSVYEVIKQEENLHISAESFERLVGFRDSAEVKERIGLADQTDVLRAEIEMKAAEVSLVAAEEKYREAKDNLKLVLAYPMDEDIAVEAPLEYHENDFHLDEAIEVSLNRRLEIKQAIDKYCESKRLSRIAKKQLWPDLNLVLNYVNSECDESFTTSVVKCCQGTTWGVGVTSNGNLDYNANRLMYEQSQISVINSQRTIDQTRDDVINEVKRQAIAMDKARQSIELRREQIEKAQEKLELSQVKFNHGLINNFDVIDPEKTIRNSEKDLLAAIVDHIIAEYRLLAAMGLMVGDDCLE
ncbi:MAG: hypothetical protein K940chlam3_01031 [Chlamydiae bacterium]|nr:hypothetical protein [Chlamydiota bacterium]